MLKNLKSDFGVTHLKPSATFQNLGYSGLFFKLAKCLELEPSEETIMLLTFD